MKITIRNNRVALVGLILSLPALCLAVVPPLVIKPEPRKVTETLLEEGANLARKLLKKDAVARPRDKAEPTLFAFRIVSIVLGLLAAFIGLFAWIRKENRRVSVAAMGVGAVAALWFYIIAAVVIAVVVAVLFALVADGA